MRKVLIYLPFFFFGATASAQVDHEMGELSAEYGFSYHSVEGTEKTNGTKGQLSSVESPYFKVAGGVRVAKNLGILLYGGTSYVQFQKSNNFALSNRNLNLNHAGIEAFFRAGNFLRVAFFAEQKERPLYSVDKPGQIKMYKGKFIQPGVHISLSQRRRVGVLWAVGGKAFSMTPYKGGAIATETGFGGEAYAKLGFMGFAGTQYAIRGYYQKATAPNATVKFTHEDLGVGLQLTKTF